MDPKRLLEFIQQNAWMLKHGDQLKRVAPYVYRDPGVEKVLLEGKFTADELEAISYFMRSKRKKENA